MDAFAPVGTSVVDKYVKVGFTLAKLGHQSLDFVKALQISWNGNALTGTLCRQLLGNLVKVLIVVAELHLECTCFVTSVS